MNFDELREQALVDVQYARLSIKNMLQLLPHAPDKVVEKYRNNLKRSYDELKKLELILRY